MRVPGCKFSKIVMRQGVPMQLVSVLLRSVFVLTAPCVDFFQNGDPGGINLGHY